MPKLTYICPTCKHKHNIPGYCEQCHVQLVKSCDACEYPVKECIC